MLSLFQAGAGIIALFGDESDTTSKILVQVGKVLTIVNALQTASNVLLTKGAIASKGAAFMEGIHAIQVRARYSAIAMANKAQGANIVVTKAATIAQAAFNVVAKANPYVLLAMALITVIGALAAFALSSDNAAEKQALLNDKVSESIELKETYISVLKRMSESNISILQRELDLMKARGASEAQLAQKERQIHEVRLKYAKQNSENHKKEISEIDYHAQRVKELSRTINERNDKLLKGEYKNNEAFKKTNEELKTKLQIHNDLLNVGLQAQEEERKAINDINKFESDLSKKGLELGKKNALALVEYRVLMAQKGSKEELIAQIAVANQKLKNDLNNAEITKGERVKRTKETLLEIEKLEADYRKAQLQDSIALIDARLSLVKKGTLEEFNLQIARLEEQKKIDLDNKDLTTNQKLQIENKYLSDVKRITDDYVESVSNNEINTSISTINARLASVKAGSTEEYNLRVELAEETARLAKEDAKNTIENEELKAAKIKEINENLQKDIRELSSDKEVSNVADVMQKETLAITQELEKRTISKRAFEDKMLAISINALQEEIKIRKKYGQDTTDLEIELSEMRIDQAERERNEVTDYFDELHTRMQKIVENITQGVTAIFDAANSVMQSQLDDANEKYEAISQKYDDAVNKRTKSNELIASLEEKAKTASGDRLLALQSQIDAQMTANQKLADQEKELAQEKEKQEKEIAKKEKQQKKIELAQNIVQGIANTALGVTKAWSLGPIIGPILAAIVGASGAIQVGVMRKQLSKLEDGGLLKGKRHASGGMRVEGTNIEVEGGEYVVNRESTAKNIGLIRYINNERRELKPTDINSFFARSSKGFEPPFKKMFETGGQLPINEVPSSDTDELAASMQQAISQLKIYTSITDIRRGEQKYNQVTDFNN